jgi:hypothetical protein
MDHLKNEYPEPKNKRIIDCHCEAGTEVARSEATKQTQGRLSNIRNKMDCSIDHFWLLPRNNDQRKLC